MRVCYISPFVPETVTTPDEMLAAWPMLRCFPPALAAQGHDVVVVAHAATMAERVRDGVRYRFIDPGSLSKRFGSALHRWRPRHGAAYYLPAVRLLRAVRAERPDIVHFSGLALDLLLAQVALACSRWSVPLVVHFHGGEPDEGRMRSVQRFNASRIDRVLITTSEQATPWIAARLFDSTAFSNVVESSSPFSGVDRDLARQRTRMVGNPVYLSAGRLDPIKDPLTMLRGFEKIAARQPDSRLYLYYLTADLMEDVKAFLMHRPHLDERIELRGRARLDEMEAIYSSADILLQASVREWSGLAVMEAMSCGCIPVVSDIPSFRVLTGDGAFGRLFRVGDAGGLAGAALSLTEDERASLASAVRRRFERDLSFDAMARQVSAVYGDVVARAVNDSPSIG